MAEVFFYTRWPDGTEMRCYAPSALVEQYLVVGRSYSVSGFLDRIGEALTLSADRVRATHAGAGDRALSQLDALRTKGATFGGGLVFVAGFD